MATKKIQLNNDKYKNAILYFITYCNNKYLGKTKLNKLLYYLDFVSFRDNSQAVTLDNYYHLDFGPVPQHIDQILIEMKESDSIDATDVPFKDGHKSEFRAIKKPDLSVFSNYEKILLSAISTELALWQTQKIVDQTHLEAPWLYSEPYEQVDYGYAADIDMFKSLANATA